MTELSAGTFLKEGCDMDVDGFEAWLLCQHFVFKVDQDSPAVLVSARPEDSCPGPSEGAEGAAAAAPNPEGAADAAAAAATPEGAADAANQSSNGRRLSSGSEMGSTRSALEEIVLVSQAISDGAAGAFANLLGPQPPLKRSRAS